MNFRLTICIVVLCMVMFNINSTAQNNPAKKTSSIDTSIADDSNEDKDLLSIVDIQYRNSNTGKKYTEATFKSTLIINGQSIENDPKGVFSFRLSHRFGDFSQGARTTYGFDNATTRIGFNYGIRDWLMLGAGRSTLFKEYDGFVKLRLLRQTTDDTKPFSISYAGTCFAQTLPADALIQTKADYKFRDRICYSQQLLIARKFTYSFSLQIMPVWFHCNIVPTSTEPNDLLALGIGGRFKVSKRIALTAEYYYRLPSYELTGYKNALSMGIDIETGGHVFQLFITNSNGINDRTFIEQTTGDWSKGSIHFGFNLTRVFNLRKNHSQGS